MYERASDIEERSMINEESLQARRCHDVESLECHEKPNYNCTCIPLNDDGSQPHITCADKPYPFTGEELEIFDQMLMVKAEVRDIKRCLAEIGNNGFSGEQIEEKQGYLDRLEALRVEWKDLKLQSNGAFTRRMILLGHIDPDLE
jgi:hypothetical protein